MPPQGSAPPAAASCLDKPYTSRGQKGGTLIAEHVVDIDGQLKALVAPDLCRPERCGRADCGSTHLYVHGRRERHPRQLVVGDEPVATVEILVFRCAECGATWRVLPLFLARCLWRTWDVVEDEALGRSRPSARPPVPKRTVQRWRARLSQAARFPQQLLASLWGSLRALAQRLHLDATRLELAQAWQGSWAELAAQLHRASPGVRLM